MGVSIIWRNVISTKTWQKAAALLQDKKGAAMSRNP
jgi:hypothetical protein